MSKMQDHLLKEIFYIVEKALHPQITSALINGRADLSLRSQILYAMNELLQEQVDDPIDIILTETQRLKLENFLTLVKRVPNVSIRQRSADSFENLLDLGCFKKLKNLDLCHINIEKVKWMSHLKSQVVSLICRQCTAMELAFSDKLRWSELSDLTLLHCQLSPNDNSNYFKNSPWIKSLSLTFCKLKDCDFLVNLDFLEHINLSFNFLTKIPKLSDSANFTVKSLLLQHNCIMDLKGIEHMKALRGIDLTHNWLHSELILKPLGQLNHLTWIKLQKTPLSRISFYRIYVVSELNIEVQQSLQFKLDDAFLRGHERELVGSNIIRKHENELLQQSTNTDTNGPSTSDVQQSSNTDNIGPSTSDVVKPKVMISSPLSSSVKNKRMGRVSLVRVPIIHDESTPPRAAENQPLIPNEEEPCCEQAPTESLNAPIGSLPSIKFTISEEREADKKATYRPPSLNDVESILPQTTRFSPTSDLSKFHLGGITIPNFKPNDVDSPISELVPETVYAQVHATDTSTDQSNEVILKSEPILEEEEHGKSVGTLSNTTVIESVGTISNTTVIESVGTLSNTTVIESEKQIISESPIIEDDLKTNFNETPNELHEESIDNKSDDGHQIESEIPTNNWGVHDSGVISDPCQLSTDINPSAKFSDHDTFLSGENNVDDGSSAPICTNNDNTQDVNTENEEQIVDSNPNVEVVGSDAQPDIEIGNGSPRDSDDESCYESDSDTDELLWHVMKLDPVTKKCQTVFLSLLEHELKERNPKSGGTINKWTLDSVLSCVKTKNDPITIEMEFDTAKSEKQHRAYIMEFADAQTLTKKIYNILESRPLSAMNQMSHNCLKCGTMFVVPKPSLFKVKERLAQCPVCGSSVVTETEEPKLPEKKALNVKALSHSPSQSSIGSEFSTAPSHKSDVLGYHRKYESDIEVISNPSQSSIEVIDESSRSQSVTPKRKVSEERHEVLATVQSAQETLSPLSALTESSSSGSLTESVITAYETHSVIINKKSKSAECLPEESCENSPDNAVCNVEKGKLEENGNVNTQPLVKDVYSFVDFSDVDLRVKEYIYHKIFRNENEELLTIVRCHIWKTGGSDYDGCFVLSTSTAYFLYHNMSDFSNPICDWLSPNESFRVCDLKRIQPVVFYQGVEIQIKDFSFILLLMCNEWTLNLVKHFSNLSLKGVKILSKPDPKVEMALQNSVLTSDLSYKSEDPSVTLMVLCRAVEVTKLDVSEEILRLAGLVITCGLFLLIPGDLSWLCAVSQPSVATSRDISTLIEVEKKRLNLVLHFLHEAEAVEEVWSIKLGNGDQLTSILDAIREPWERQFSIPLEVTGQ